MLRWMDGASRSFAFGATTNCCSTAGHAAPTSTLDSTSSTTRDRGQLQVAPEHAPTKNAAAQMTAMNSRIILAGSTALMSV